MHYTWVSSWNRHDKYTSIQFILSFTGYRNLTLIRRVFHQTMIPEWRKVYQSWAEDWWSDQAPTPKSNSWLSLVVKPRSSKSKSLIWINSTSRITNHIYTFERNLYYWTGQQTWNEVTPQSTLCDAASNYDIFEGIEISYAFNLGKMYGQR